MLPSEYDQSPVQLIGDYPIKGFMLYSIGDLIIQGVSGWPTFGFSIFRDHCRDVVDICKTSDNWSEGWGNIGRKTRGQRKHQRQRYAHT